MRIEELLEFLGKDFLIFKPEPQIYLRDFEKWLVSDNWEKVTEEDSDVFSNFTVVYRKGNCEMELFCDPDAYIIHILIRKIMKEGEVQR